MIYIRVDELLKERDKTRYWLVKKVNSDYDTVNRIADRNSVSIRLDMIDRLMEAFELEDINELIVRVKE